MDQNQDMNKGGVKFDIGKPRVDLLPPNAILALADLFRMGADKYDDRNWEKGMDEGRLLAAAGRHYFRYLAGEDIDPDPEAGTHNLIHLAWCALAAYELQVCGKSTNCRTGLRVNKSVDKPEQDVNRFIDDDLWIRITKDTTHLSEGETYIIKETQANGYLIDRDAWTVMWVSKNVCEVFK